MATTPPPHLTRTPPAPRLGTWADEWPASPRKSSRIASRKEPERSSSPQRKSVQPATDSIEGSSNVPSSPRKRAIAPDQVHRASGVIESKPASDRKHSRLAPPHLLAAQSGMLPTPSKTPSQRKKTITVNFETAARKLEFNEEPMPSPKKTASYGDSFVEDDDEFPIHVDSKERVPVRDESSDNPFDDAYVVTTTKKKRTKKVLIPGEGVVSIHEAVGRDDGTLMSFRGRTQFLKHAEVDENGDGSFRLPAKSVSRQLFTRSFKVEEKTAAEIEEEEAETDVEDHVDEPEAEEVAATKPEIQVEAEAEADQVKVPATPRASRKKGVPMTPDAPRFGLDTPPDTRRVTRSTTKVLDKPVTSPPAVNSRPTFANFRVTKAKKNKDLLSDSKPITRKRAADQPSAPPVSKRART